MAQADYTRCSGGWPESGTWRRNNRGVCQAPAAAREGFCGIRYTNDPSTEMFALLFLFWRKLHATWCAVFVRFLPIRNGSCLCLNDRGEQLRVHAIIDKARWSEHLLPVLVDARRFAESFHRAFR